MKYTNRNLKDLKITSKSLHWNKSEKLSSPTDRVLFIIHDPLGTCGSKSDCKTPFRFFFSGIFKLHSFIIYTILCYVRKYNYVCVSQYAISN